jgi:hypothetical protein
VDIEFSGDFAASASQTTAGILILLSRTVKDEVHLLLAKSVEVKGRLSTYLKNEMSAASSLLPLDGVSLRGNLSSEWGTLMTEHLMRVHDHLDRDPSDVVAYTAWRYATLTAWGEASAARELSLDLKTSIHTIHYRLKLARDRGILPSPGAGARLG